MVVYAYSLIALEAEAGRSRVQAHPEQISNLVRQGFTKREEGSVERLQFNPWYKNTKVKQTNKNQKCNVYKPEIKVFSVLIHSEAVRDTLFQVSLVSCGSLLAFLGGLQKHRSNFYFYLLMMLSPCVRVCLDFPFLSVTIEVIRKLSYSQRWGFWKVI